MSSSSRRGQTTKDDCIATQLSQQLSLTLFAALTDACSRCYSLEKTRLGHCTRSSFTSLYDR